MNLSQFEGVVKKQEVMIANYLTLIQFVEIHIEFRNNNHPDNIVATESAEEHIEAAEEHIEAAEEHIEAAGEHIEAAEEHIQAAEGHIEAAVEHIEAAGEHIEAAEEHIEAAEGHIEAAGEHIEDNDIVGIEDMQMEFVEQYYHILLMSS